MQLNATVTKVDAGSAVTIDTRFYLGMKLIGGSAASSVVAHNDNAATSGPMVGACACAANSADADEPVFPTPLDGIGANAEKNKLYVAVTGTSAYALVRHSQ